MFLIGPLEISLIVIGGLIALALIIFLVLFFGSRKRVVSNVRDLHRKYDYFHALLIGKCSQGVRRLELISRSNLLYSDIYARFAQSFNSLKDKDDVKASHALKVLDDALGKKQYKECKNNLSNGREMIQIYEKNMLNFNRDLDQVLRPEEDIHQKSLSVKENLRSVKQDYFSKQVDLGPLNPSYEHIFNVIDKKFNDIELSIDAAQYDEANAILLEIETTLKALKEALTVSPVLVALVTTLLPQKIQKVEEMKEKLEAIDVPLNHLLVTSGINDLKKELSEILKQLKLLNVKGLQERLNNIDNKIDTYVDEFEKEKEAKDSFDSRYEELYEIVNNLEKRFVKLCHSLPEVRKFYVINTEYENRLDEIRQQIDGVGQAKRTLDNFVHSSTRQPYTILVDHMNDLQAKADEAFDSMETFTHYLHSLKTHTEEAFETIHSIYINLKLAAKKVRDIAVPSVDIYEETFEEAYGLIKSIDETLKILPIDVQKIVANLEELNKKSTEIITSIDRMYNLATLAEVSIVYANRSRQRFNNLNQQMQTFEQKFFAGDFEKVYYDTRSVLSKVETSEKK